MLIPYGTETPIYHWPFATGVLIALNIIAFPIQWSLPTTSPPEVPALEQGPDGMPGEDAAQRMIKYLSARQLPGWLPYALSHGDGLRPIQWLTSFFMHGSIGHLLGNMIFLWAFGVVVEGKTGPLVFSLLYMGIGIVQNIIEQVLYLGTVTGPSLGASSAIYGILVVSMLLAPRDNLKCFTIFFYRAYFFGVPILIFAMFYVLWDLSFASMAGFEMGTPLLHVMGAAVGLVAGIGIIRGRLARTDNADLFSLFQELAGVDIENRPPQLTRREEANQEKARQQARQQQIENRKQASEVAWSSFDKHLAAGNPDAAMGVYQRLRSKQPNEQLSESRLLKVIRGCMEQENWDSLCRYSAEYVSDFTAKATIIRLNWAKVLLQHRESPRKAMKVLQELDVNTLEPKQLQVAKQLAARAKKMIAEGTIEFDDD